MKKRQKHSSMVVTLVLLLNIFTQFAVPMVTYATTDTPPNEEITLSAPEVFDLEDEENEVTVEGYIVGYVQDEDVLRENFVDDSNIALADDPKELDSANMLFIELPESFAAEFGLNSNPELLDEEITLTGSTGEYLGHNGLVDITALSLTVKEIEEIEESEESEEPEVVEEVEVVEETEEDFEEEATEELIEVPVEEDSEEFIEKETIEETSADTVSEAESFAMPLQEDDDEDLFELPLMHMNDTHARVDG